MTNLLRNEINQRIQAYLRAHALRREDHERIGPFLASFDKDTDNRYLNYAVPDDGAAPLSADIDRLTDSFLRRGRMPRLEYIAEAAPCVEPALIAKGFAIEKRFPILVCIPGGEHEQHSDNIGIALARDDGDIVAAAEVGAEAYGSETCPEPMRRLVTQGGVLMVAREPRSGRTVGAGMATPAHEGTSEVAGIGVHTAFRRRGIAGALTAAITREAFVRGVTLAWLAPGHDGAERIYMRAGFVRASEQLHISKPA
jgi:ribosomal protein S18 acetylase RimI-like enzyme